MDRLTGWETDLEACEPERHTPCEIFDIVQKRQRTVASGDNWNLDSFVLSGLRDPARLWLQDFQ